MNTNKNQQQKHKKKQKNNKQEFFRQSKQHIINQPQYQKKQQNNEGQQQQRQIPKNVTDAIDPLVINIEEDLIAPYTNKLKEQIQKKINSGKIKLIFNCSAVNIISSAGFALLLGFLRITRGLNGDLKLSNLKPNIVELIKIAHLDLSFEIFKSDEEAIKSFKDKTEIQFRLEKKKRIKELLKKSSFNDDLTEPIY
ncbi:MAG TPA: STAS domain-containing protein [bacterium]|nr:STAS domain-containing protein [bacterium]